MFRSLFFAFAILSSGIVCSAQKTYEVVSPDQTLKASVSICDGAIKYSVEKDGTVVLSPSEISMTLGDGTAYDGSVKFRKFVSSASDKVLDAPFYKKSKVKDNYSQALLQFKTFDLVFRVYDAGVAYRFVSTSKTPFKVKAEKAEFAYRIATSSPRDL